MILNVCLILSRWRSGHKAMDSGAIVAAVMDLFGSQSYHVNAISTNSIRTVTVQL